MFNDDDYDDDSSGCGIPENLDPAQMMSLDNLRDHALNLFDEHSARASGGINPAANLASLEEKSRFLTLEETEQIVREFSSADNGEVMAVGGNTPQEAVMTITKLMQALLTRIMSNVVAEGVKRGYLDSHFDSENNAFAFSVSRQGFEFIQQNAALFKDYPEYNDDDPLSDD
jgi:hypothetical protein